MKKNDILTFKAPNGVEATAVVLGIIQVHHKDGDTKMLVDYLCYSQNRIFLGSSWYGEKDGETKEWDFTQEKVFVDYAILPNYDELLETYNDHQMSLAETAAGM